MRETRSILLVEDDRIDALTVKRALKEIGDANPLKIVSSGEEALIFLGNAANEKPCIILLDLNMPRMNGIEFLRLVKQDAALRRIPVVVLTTSQEEQDRLSSFDLGVAGYMVKPISYADFVEMMKTISHYWSLSDLSD